MAYYWKHSEADVRKLAESLTETPELGGFEVRRMDYGTPGHFYLAKGDLEIIIMELQGGNTVGKLSFKGYYPRDEHQDVYGIEHHSITVSVSRGPQAIAKDIERRLLPKYAASLKEFQAKVEEGNRRRAARDELTAELARRLPRGHSSTQGSSSYDVAYFDDGRTYDDGQQIHGKLEVSTSASVHIDVRTGNRAFLLELADLIAKHSA